MEQRAPQVLPDLTALLAPPERQESLAQLASALQAPLALRVPVLPAQLAQQEPV
tara:strand:+ start:280 stop:441 length:162 start_codon:yes stop_codon:yes gene_type:complete